jgi:hypothetical protein
VKTEDHIKRLLSDPDGLDFDGLRRKGIALLQDLSSQQWTDYNLHDPGVMLLEILSYGLTDLAYRTNFDVADLLTGPSGSIDFYHQALFPPRGIFPNEPVTDGDFCKLIYDRLTGVDDVWIRQEPASGLFTVFVKPNESLIDDDKSAASDDLAAEVEKLLAEHRNIGRDVDRVCIVKSQHYTLGGEIVIDDSRPAAEIYADIYFQCAKQTSSGGRVVRFEDALAQGMSWEELLEGPLTGHGYIADDHFKQANYEIDVIKLITLVRHIPGVVKVKRLCLEDEEGQEHSDVHLAPGGEVCPVLSFPKTDTPPTLRLVHDKAGGQWAVGGHDDDPQMPDRQALQFHEQASLYLRKLEFEHNAFRNNDGQLERLLPLPQGQYRELAEYSSVGEHTPAIYGINRYGVPKSYPPAAHARAAQLKAYLYPFEQLMANHLASLQGLRTLYSTDDSLDRTYFAQWLDNEQIPNVKPLYRGDVTRQEVDAVLGGQDDFSDRRNRVLDSLLAVYGEVFPTDALRRYDVYHAEDVDRHLIGCKISLLDQLCRLSAQRGLAMNVKSPYLEGWNYAAIQLRVQLLSGGSVDTVGRSLVSPLLQRDLKFVSDKRYLDKLGREVNYTETLPLAWGEGALGEPGLPFDTLSPSVLMAGIHRDNYRKLPATDGRAWLCLRLDEQRCWPLALVAEEDLSALAPRWRKGLIEMNRACEGFHLLEHVLLRQRGSGKARKVEADFYAHRVSVLLPAFTARFSDPACRAWMEELISQHLPAHILPVFYWLDFAFMAQFEKHYQHWLELLSAGADLNGIDAAADRLIVFLGDKAQYHTNRYWM